jgi:hypothetical protein
MAKDDFELVVNAELNAAKEVVDELMEKMGFTLAYSNSFEATAQRGSGLASALAGPFAGKNNVAVKFALSFRESGGKTSVFLSDSGSGLGKALTLTGGATKKVLQDVYNTLKEGVSRKGL